MMESTIAKSSDIQYVGEYGLALSEDGKVVTIVSAAPNPERHLR